MVSARGSRGIFRAEFPLTAVSDCNGRWRCVINAGTADGENLHFDLAGLDEAAMPPFPGYPELNHQSLYNKVSAPMTPTFVGPALATASGHTSSETLSDSVVYTFPDGAHLFTSGMEQGKQYTIMGSTDLSDWSPLSVFSSESNAMRHAADASLHSHFFKVMRN